MRNKVNEIMLRAKSQAVKVLYDKDLGIQTIMVIALVCVVAVSLTAMFRTEAGNLISSIYDTMTTSVNDTLFKEFVV